MKLLIAFDGSEHAKAAIRDLRRCGIPEDAAAVVTAVGERMMADIGRPTIDPQISRRAAAALIAGRAEAAEALRDARQVAQQGTALVKEWFPTWDVETDARLGEPGRTIINGAEERRADLVVVGSRGRSALGRFLIGSVSQYVATCSTASVLVSRHVSNRRDSPVRIIVGIDGSSSSRAAVEAVAARRWNQDTEVRVTAVADTHRPTSTVKQVPTAAAWVAESNQLRRETAHGSLDDAVRLLSGAGVRVSGDTGEGAAHRILCDRAAEFDADSIFVGGRSFSSDVGPTAGTDVVSGLVTSAPCSVEIVR